MTKIIKNYPTSSHGIILSSFDQLGQQSTTQVNVKKSGCTIVVGPNGVGKSALLEDIAKNFKHSGGYEKFGGHRQIYFQSDEVDQIGQSWESF
jgi:predicted ATPase